MNYIQNKLDEFDKQFIVKSNANTDLLRYTDANKIKHFIKQSITDYHNHIVEKIKQRFESGEYEMEDGFSYQKGIELSEVPNELFIELKGVRKGIAGVTKYIKEDILSLLQDTNK
mgnify:CR=1 FL=1